MNKSRNELYSGLSAGELSRACLIKFSGALGANPPPLRPSSTCSPTVRRRCAAVSRSEKIMHSRRERSMQMFVYFSSWCARARARSRWPSYGNAKILSLVGGRESREIGPRHLPRRRPILSSRSIDTTDIEIHRLRGRCLVRPSRALNARHLPKLRSMGII